MVGTTVDDDENDGDNDDNDDGDGECVAPTPSLGKIGISTITEFRTFNLFHLTFLKYSSSLSPPSSSSSHRSTVPPMGLIKEYVDRGVQTEAETLPSPYSDPAVVLAAPPVTRHGLAQAAHTAHHSSILASSPTGSDSAYAVPPSPTSPMLAPLVSRRLSKRKHARCPAGDIVNRRIVSMPENNSENLSHGHGKRVVSMPDRVRPVLEPSVELFQSPSTAAGDSFGSYCGRHERVRVFRAPSDVPYTPSPPSSPESLLIIAAGAQFPEGFLRRKCSPEPLIEEDEAIKSFQIGLHGRTLPLVRYPLSTGPFPCRMQDVHREFYDLRCKNYEDLFLYSGAEGTIIEEPDNVAQMIWGLGPDDQPHNQVRTEAPPSNHENPPSHGPSQIIPRLQKKRTSATQQVPKSSRAQSSHTSHAKQSFARPQRQTPDDKHTSLSQVSPDTENRQDIVSGLPWNEGQPIPTNVGVPDNFLNDADLFPVDNNSLLEWQLARLRQALRTSLADIHSYTAYPGRLEPVIPAAVASGLPQSYPRIFVEPRPNEFVNSPTRQLPIEIAQQYRQQQLYMQALQKKKMQIQNLLPTPPNSSSPQWSSHFSPYLTYGSTFSPELVGSTEHPIPVSSQKHRTGTDASQHPRHVYDRHEHDHVNNFDTSTNTLSAKTPQIAPNVNSVPSLSQSSSSSSTLAKYIKQLQALSPIAHFSPLQPVPPPNASLPPLSSNESTVPFRTVYHSPVVPTPPSPESPQTLSRGSSYHGVRSMAPTRLVQRRLSSVPEEDSALLELSTFVSPSRLQSQVTSDGISSIHDGPTGHQIRYVDIPPEQAITDLGAPSIATSPVKVRLPVTKEQNVREQTNSGHQHAHRKKQRYKKFKGPAATNEPATTRGLVG
ncbi:hypothetical protein L210DRAFT_1055831 [Boletus edulis BED1]|uniref:Uncharacterized protein n=1 Tax=Boletus edulis BED1 TaxID=1328754 RepID=A0AAD4GFS6_BOLED|nr:hypothetical protein L210DRAFT_1055831 [Boletus edulis BED1]